MSSAPQPDRPGPPDLVLANARLVLPGEVIRGSVAVAGGLIAEIAEGRGVPAGALDCQGETVVPGLIELHTDNLEKHIRPRPGVLWPGDAAVVAHDGEIAAAGITTVFDAIRAGTLESPEKSFQPMRYASEAAGHISRLHKAGALRVDHFLHVRAELCSRTVLEEMDEFAGNDMVRIVSIMDHTPGHRQYVDESKYRYYHQTRHGISDAAIDAHVAHIKTISAEYGAENELGVVERARRLGAVLASHDDTDAAHVARSAEIGVAFAEFPTTLVAARACHAAGIAVMMGAPNILRGGSHSGNVAALDLAEAGVLDMLSSDYAPSALLMGAMRLARLRDDLPGAMALVTSRPAKAVGLTDRGEIGLGKRADLLTLREVGGLDVVTGVWSRGRKVG